MHVEAPVPVVVRSPARGAGWRKLISIPDGCAGWVEARAFDVGAEVRLSRPHYNGNDVVDLDIASRPRRIGPGGSCGLFKVEGPAVVEYRVLCTMPAASGHVDPASGVFDAQGTTDARLTARYSATKPDTYGEQHYVWSGSDTLGAGEGDAVAIAAEGESLRIYPTGYCRVWEVTLASATPTGTLNKRSLSPQGLNTDTQAFDCESHVETLGSSGGGYVSPWEAITISNDHATDALAARLLMRSPDRGE